MTVKLRSDRKAHLWLELNLNHSVDSCFTLATAINQPATPAGSPLCKPSQDSFAAFSPVPCNASARSSGQLLHALNRAIVKSKPWLIVPPSLRHCAGLYCGS